MEEGPGIVVGGDQTDALRLGYWASFNVPFYNSVYEHMGYPSMVKKFAIISRMTCAQGHRFSAATKER